MEDWKERYKKLGYDDTGKDLIIDIDLYPFTKEEVDLLQHFFCCDSHLFRADYMGIDNNYHDHIMKVLNNIVCKMPRYDGSVVYRCCHKEDRADFVIGEEFCPMESLTTSTMYNFRPLNKAKDGGWTTHKYVINILPIETTKAHDFRQLRMEHEEGRIKEGQINFEQGTIFRVDKIVWSRGWKCIYMTEK